MTEHMHLIMAVELHPLSIFLKAHWKMRDPARTPATPDLKMNRNNIEG
jgi:hypothetical protein